MELLDIDKMATQISPESSDQEACASRDQSLDVMSISSDVDFELDSSSVNPLPSLLDAMKCPAQSELARKRKISSNKPPMGKKRGRGRVTSSPISVQPLDCVKLYPGGFRLN